MMLPRSLLGVTSFAIPVISGAGILWGESGPLPKPRPVTAVVGSPIKVSSVTEYLVNADKGSDTQGVEKFSPKPPHFVSGSRMTASPWRP